jgi:uncharacterized coiled-coil DUF342 family protein
MYTITYHGINCWYEAMFEKLGWMILAKRDGYHDKLEEYKKSLRHLKEAIEEKHKVMVDVDKKHDLMILHKNVGTLIEHVSHDFTKRAPKKKATSV